MTKVLILKRIFFVFCLFYSCIAYSQQELLKNETVIQLVKLGIGNDVIIDKIKTSTVNFDVSIEQLIKLKEIGVSDSIVSEMIKASGKSKDSKPEIHQSGIFVSYLNGDSLKVEKQIVPNAISGQKSKNLLGAAFSYGLSSVKTVAIIPNPMSAIQLSTSKPEFLFYFSKSTSSLNNSGFSFESNSPNEFVLIKLALDGEQRIFQTGKASIGGYSFGVSEKDMIAFEIEQVNSDTYRIKFNQDLASGEYAFIPKNSGALGSSFAKVYDFGITL